METFAEVRAGIMAHHKLDIDEPFLLSFECPVGDGNRRQSMFVAEIKATDGRRFLRVETPVAPLSDLEAEKCLRINLVLRVGYLAVGDMDGVPYIKMCHNLSYATLNEDELEYIVSCIAPLADRIENSLEEGRDIS